MAARREKWSIDAIDADFQNPGLMVLILTVPPSSHRTSPQRRREAITPPIVRMRREDVHACIGGFLAPPDPVRLGERKRKFRRL